MAEFKNKLSHLCAPLVPERIRLIGKSFAFIPHRFLRDGFLTSLFGHETRLYLFLVLAANRHGISFYGYESICANLGLTVEQYIEARRGLIDKNLIAFDGTRFQVLELPEKPIVINPPLLKTDEDFETHDPATIRLLLSDQFDFSDDE